MKRRSGAQDLTDKLAVNAEQGTPDLKLLSEEHCRQQGEQHSRTYMLRCWQYTVRHSKIPSVMLQDDVINRARIQHADMDAEFAVSQALKEQAAQEITALMDNEGMAADEEAAMEAEMEMQGIPPPGGESQLADLGFH